MIAWVSAVLTLFLGSMSALARSPVCDFALSGSSYGLMVDVLRW